MEMALMQRIADAIGDNGFVIKKIEEETYGYYDRPKTGERYTGEIILKIRPIEEEEAEAKRHLSRQAVNEKSIEAGVPL
jgi:hypothetical protein